METCGSTWPSVCLIGTLAVLPGLVVPCVNPSIASAQTSTHGEQICDMWVHLVISARGHEEGVILLVNVKDACARAGASCIR